MIDTRSHWRMKDLDREYWRLERRWWWSPFWLYETVVSSQSRALEEIERFYSKRKPVYLGRFPKREGEA